MRKLFAGILSLVFIFGFSVYAAYSQLTLTLADIHSPAFHARNIKIHFVDQQASQLEIHIGEIAVQDNLWRNVNLSCDQFQVDRNHVECASGQLNIPNLVSLPIAFQFDALQKKLQLNIKPASDEDWQFSIHWDEDNWQALLNITDGQAAHFARWMLDNGETPVPSHGTINAAVKLGGNLDGLTHFVVDLSVNRLSFSDQIGLHAGENLELILKANADYIAENKRWRWHTEMDWLQGEVFWQPVYFVGHGHRLHLNGMLSDKDIRLHDGKLSLVGIGEFEFAGLMVRPDNILHDFELRTKNLELSAIFEHILKPFLSDTAFAELVVSGQSDVTWQYRDGANEAMVLELDDVSVIDQRGRFAFNRVDALIPWRANTTTIADISVLNGHALRIPFGAVRVPLEIRGFSLLLPQLVLPVLDGELTLQDFVASYQSGRWFWTFGGNLAPISMESLTEALQVPKMHGSLSGYIPEVSYDGNKKMVSVDGELLFNVFDGSVTANNLSLLDPMGFAPYFKADIEMRNLDLGLLTETFSFGKMEGRIDMVMRQMALSKWKPVIFDASLMSSAGNYPRRISQAAIKNISSLGGESGMVAIQRSFLRFFEEFSYTEIGWRCVLRNNVCTMGGIESESQSNPYTLVKGGGIPAITVMGYNQKVDWQELIDRLKRVAEESEPVIQ